MSSEKSKRDKSARGLVLINTGNSKGKTTAGLGLLMRAWGRGMNVACVQFIKADGAKYGEHKAAEKMGIKIISSGRGFTWTSKDLNEDAAKARHGWEIARTMLLSGDYQVLMLDEITYAVTYGWLTVDEIIKTLEERPKETHVIITGRNAHPALIEVADMVTEMVSIKHHFDDQGIQAQIGIEF